MTLNQIINKIKTQAESHKMVGKFAVGAEFDFAVEEVKYYHTDFDISVNGQADPFFDSRTDVVAGHGINFTINTPYLESYCDIPT
jgi:hypothetical protein